MNDTVASGKGKEKKRGERGGMGGITLTTPESVTTQHKHRQLKPSSSTQTFVGTIKHFCRCSVVHTEKGKNNLSDVTTTK